MTSLVTQKRRRFLLQRTLALLLAAALLAVPAASAKTVSVEVPWEKARTIIAEGDFLPKIWVELHSSERLKGKLIEATGTGLRLVRLRYETKIAKSGSGRRQSARRFERQDTETLIERKEIRTIRLRPRKTTRTKYRLLGLLGGIPVGFFGGVVGAALACGGNIESSRCKDAARATGFIATLIAVPYGFYKLGARADRGTVLIVLDESAPDSSRDGSQAERPSSAKEERP